MKILDSSLHTFIGRGFDEWRVCEDNPFMLDYYNHYGDVTTTRPNWALILLPIAVILAVVVAIVLYRNWRKNNCCPIFFAGKVKYARKGETIRSACSASGFEADWLVDQKYWLRQQGKTIVALYTDPALTVPLNEDQIVNGPVHIFPKLQK